ncbi:hypothetical protein P3X46_011899 [Hevea brasiliensis]|uniref:Ninja-family protein n=1 Tax=Hevea brasiliensis TaxID=3981 RepID=A0ABQ9MAW8_HEVBR|nr:uncharacterized protein LOC110672026 [Hevea brasiliensis]KAJ9176607.1 hypothetical protein P3X46_011899 [Hevea brasiliensis]
MGSDDCAMVTKTALKEEEIELELGLSIGGRYKRQNGTNSISDTTVDMGSKEKHPSCPRSSVSRCFNGDIVQEIDPKTKREIHALRRQEAKKKREEKQLRKGFCKGYFNGGQQINGEINVNNNNGMWLKAKAFQAKERVADTEERRCKKSKTYDIGSDHNDTKKVNLNLCVDQNHCTSYPPPSTLSPVHPVLPLQYPQPSLQYGQPENGFVFPCANVNVMPCWFTGGDEKNVGQVQPLVGYGFVPFQAASIQGHNLGNGYESEQNGSRDGGKRKAGSNGSATCTSSTGSDHRSFSHEGGGRSDIRSHSSPFEPEQPQLNCSNVNDVKGSFEHSATSLLTDNYAQVNDPANHVEKMIQFNSPQSSPTGPNEEAELETELDPSNSHISTPESPTMGENKGDVVGKSPKPPAQNHSTHISSLPYMPCVSTTGNSPNGKTINGFLYRYTKTEVSIICVCHGTSFSPAEFVQHAGGTAVSHPLRHITVIPSPL